MEEITVDTVREAVTASDPMMEAVAILMREIARDAVGNLAGILSMTGADPTLLPGEYLLQAVLVESDKVFKPISRERWIEVYDVYHTVQGIIDANPDIKEAYQQEHQVQGSPVDALLDGLF